MGARHKSGHRADKSCAGCHERFDAIGLAFEGYGPVGESRDLDLGGRPVDARATFPGGPEGDGIAQVASLGQRAALGMDHPRSGDIILVAAPDRWFAPDWWARPEEAPRSASGAASGLAHATTGGLLLDPAHVQGSLGAPPPGEEYLGVVISSEPLPGTASPGGRLAARDLAGLILRSLGPVAPAPGPG